MPEKISGPGRDSRGRFASGVSPNPKGRPKKAKAAPASGFGVLFDRTVKLTTPDGSMRELTAKEAVDLQVFKDAMEGKARAIAQVTRWLIARDRWIRSEAADKEARKAKYDTDRTSSARMYTDPENAIEALQILGIASGDHTFDVDRSDSEYIRLLLEPWAVQAALSRLRSAVPYEEKEVEEIMRCTRDPENLSWPKGAR